MLPGETIRSGADSTDASEFKVMESANGFYIGTSYFDEDIGCEMPNTRESGYYNTYEEAASALANNTVNWR